MIQCQQKFRKTHGITHKHAVQRKVKLSPFLNYAAQLCGGNFFPYEIQGTQKDLQMPTSTAESSQGSTSINNIACLSVLNGFPKVLWQLPGPEHPHNSWMMVGTKCVPILLLFQQGTKKLFFTEWRFLQQQSPRLMSQHIARRALELCRTACLQCIDPCCSKHNRETLLIK